MQISSRRIDTTSAGSDIYAFILKNDTGATVELSNLGARWISAITPDRDGVMRNVLLSPDDITADPYYMGATVGRVANRIANGEIVIDGRSYSLEKNDNGNTNHGGMDGFDKKLWAWRLLEDGVAFTRLSPDGEGGFPGNVHVEVDYRWSDNNELTVTFNASTDAPTCLNLTNHAYFNLAADGSTINDHVLEIPSQHILETTQTFIPTGQLTPVAHSPFDFTTAKPIGRDIDAVCDQLIWNRGYNHCYVLKEKSDSRMIKAASLCHQGTGRTLDILTDQNAVLLYTAGYYAQPNAAVCLETQNWVDAPSHPSFPSCIIHPNDTYRQRTIYQFGICAIS